MRPIFALLVNASGFYKAKKIARKITRTDNADDMKGLKTLRQIKRQPQEGDLSEPYM